MLGVGKAYRLKEGSIERPTTYLGALIREHCMPDNLSKTVWSLSAEKYLKEAVRIVEADLNKLDRRLPSGVPTPLSSCYHPELDVSAILDEDLTNWYQ
jgi:hypothetical protein